MKLKLVWVVVLAASVLCNSSAFAKDDVTELKKQIESLQKRVEELESSDSKSDNAFGGFFNQNANRGWDPFAQMHRMQEQMDRMFQNSFNSSAGAGTGVFSNTLSFDDNFDVKETDGGYEIVFDMQGLDEDKIDLQINEHSITVKGEQSKEEKKEGDNSFFHAQSFGTFMRTIPVPANADTTKVKTEKVKDTLIIKLPKK